MCLKWRRDVVKKWDASRACPGLHTPMCSKGDSWMWVHRFALMIHFINQLLDSIGPHRVIEQEKKTPLKWKRCHYDLTRNTSHSTNGSDFSQVWCYAAMRLKILMMILLPCSQHKLTNIKYCRLLLADCAQNRRKYLKTAWSFSMPGEKKNIKAIIPKLLTGAHKCQRSISWDVLCLFCYWNLEIAAPPTVNVLLCIKKEECAQNTVGLLHICGALAIGLLHSFSSRHITLVLHFISATHLNKLLKDTLLPLNPQNLKYRWCMFSTFSTVFCHVCLYPNLKTFIWSSPLIADIPPGRQKWWVSTMCS